VLATLFSLLMLLANLEALARPGPGLLAASALLYLLAVLSKENVITMPAVALAATFLARRPSWALIRRLWPYYGLCAAVAVWVLVRELGQHQGIHGLGAVRATPGLDPAWRALDPSHLHLRSVITQGYLFFRYLLLWLIPNVGWMSIDLQYPLAPALASWPESLGLAAFGLYPVAAGWLLWRGGRAGLVGFGLLWPWLLFLPELGTIRLTEPFVLYRSYPWIPGILAALVVSAAPLLGRRAVPLLGGLCVMLGGLGHERLLTFASADALWDDAVGKNRPYERQAIGAYRAYLNRGQARLHLDRMEEALADFATALELRPGLPHAYFDRGLAYIRLGRYPEALTAFDEGMAFAGTMPETARARAYSNRAGLYLLLGRPEDAFHDLARAAALDSDRAEYRVNLERLRSEIRLPSPSR